MGCDNGPNPHTHPELFYSPKGGKQFNVYDRPSMTLRRQVATICMKHAGNPLLQMERSRWVKTVSGKSYVCVCKINVLEPKPTQCIYSVWVERSELERIGWYTGDRRGR